jgi:hypothetical protein
VDVLAGLSAIGWSIAGLYAAKLAILCDPLVAFSFGCAAITRGLIHIKGH